MSLNQSSISDFSEYSRWSQRTKIKYKLHYGWCTGRRFTAATRHNTSCSEVKWKSEMRSFKSNENIHKKEGGHTSHYVASWHRPPNDTSEDFQLFRDQPGHIRNQHKGNKLPSVHVLGDFNFKDIDWPDRLNKSGAALSQSEGKNLDRHYE